MISTGLVDFASQSNEGWYIPTSSVDSLDCCDPVSIAWLDLCRSRIPPRYAGTLFAQEPYALADATKPAGLELNQYLIGCFHDRSSVLSISGTTTFILYISQDLLMCMLKSKSTHASALWFRDIKTLKQYLI